MNHMYAHVLDLRILKSLKNPQKIQSFDETRDPYENNEHMDERLKYYHAHGAVIWKLFALTLTGLEMAWLKALMD